MTLVMSPPEDLPTGTDQTTASAMGVTHIDNIDTQI